MPFFNIDIPCPSCRYNLRGLSLERGCPECGLKIISTSPVPERRKLTDLIEAEVEENLRLQAEADARQRRLDELLTAWDQRGLHFDQVLDRIEKILTRFEGNP